MKLFSSAFLVKLAALLAVAAALLNFYLVWRVYG